MRKEVFSFSALFVFLIFILPLIFAANQTQVNDAYDCLKEKINDKTCEKLGLEEKIFSLLAVGKCRSELMDDSKDDKCWPKQDCNVKATAQATLALGGSSKAEAWLVSQEQAPSELIWYLQIETDEQSTCTITYDDSPHTIKIWENKTINSAAGSCLSLSNLDSSTPPDGYWLEVSPDCYNKSFEISCDQGFLTTLLFKKEAPSKIIHVLEQATSASAEGTTTEKVESLCFVKGGSCDYEASLWATLVLESLDYEIDAHLPYLISMADQEENKEYLPEAFLYILTDYADFRNELLSRQTSNGYWQLPRNKYYGTALALYGFQYEEFEEKTDAQNWLLKIQGDDGCWNAGNILDTAFILYSVWPKTTNGGDGIIDCIDAGGYCMSEASCISTGGRILPGYDCLGVFKCCDTPQTLKTCEDMGGKICGVGEECSSSTVIAAGGIECCLDYCKDKAPTESYDCVSLGKGVCERYECGEGYEQTDDYTCEYGDKCCIAKTKPPLGGKVWLWILIILVFLVVLGIIFRDKLRMFWMRLRRPKPRGGPGPGPGLPPVPSTDFSGRRIRPRRILPSAHVYRRAPPRIPAKTHGELDEVLKKLKDMGKINNKSKN